MKQNHLLATLFVFFALIGHSQFKRSYNHFYRTPRIYQSFALEQPNQKIDLVRAETAPNGDLLITTTAIDQNGDALTVSKFSFDYPAVTNSIPLITGVFDVGTDRIIMMELPVTSTMNLFVLKYNNTTGVETAQYLHTNLCKTGFVNAILNGNEIVNYAIKSTGGLYRIAFNTQTITSFTEESIDPAATSAGSLPSLSTGKDGGKVILFNGKEVCALASGTKQLYERTAANNYSVHALNANSSGCVNLVNIPNGNLVVHNNGDLFEINSTFNIVNSTTGESSTGCINSEFSVLNNQLHLFYTKTGQQKVSNLIYDLTFNLTDSIAQSNQKLIDLLPFNNGLALIGSLASENQVNALYDGDNVQFSSTPVTIDYFTGTSNPEATQEFHHSQTINNLYLDLGLGNQFFPLTNDNTSALTFNDSLGIVYNMANVYSGFANPDTLGMNGSFFEPNFLPGPYTANGMYTDLVSDKYNRGFFVSREMIENHLDSLAFGSAGYIAPHGIRNWPAHGDVSIGQVQDLAAFVDVNSNGQYEPYLGDYPSIYGDYCFFSITHDNPNTEKSAFVETHSYKYWFDCDTSKAYENTIFNKSLYFSRVKNFATFRLATMSDIDLGNYSDDYNGTHVELGLVYNYNGDMYDENMAGRAGFKDKCPATGVMILKGTKVDADGLDNPDGITQSGSVNGYGFGDGTIDNEYLGLENSFVFTGSGISAQSDPQFYDQYANYLNGFWKFGDTLYYGGSGFAPNSTSLRTKFMYPGDSDTLFYGTGGVNPGFTPWSEFEPMGTGSTSNQAGDRRITGSTGSQKLLIGDTVIYDIVYVISNDTSVVTAIDQSSNNLFAKCKVIKENFNNNAGSCGITFDPIEQDLAVSEQIVNNVLVYPNPTNGTFRISGLMNPNSTIAIYDLEGRLLFEQQNINTQTEFSLADFKGNLFMISVQDGSNHFIKRIVKN